MLKTKSSLDTEHYYFVYCLFVQDRECLHSLKKQLHPLL